jgi:tRNA (guanine-N7-)-methyltransferase
MNVHYENQVAESGASLPSNSSTLIYRLPCITERLDLAALFSKTQPLEVELGCGDGSFLCQYAARHSEHNYLGVERLLGRLRKVERKGGRAGLKNLRLLRIEASYVVEYLLPPGSVQALHVYFPDPWPKRKHRKKRLINERFTELAYRALAPGGIVYVRTDDVDYFAQITTVFGENRNFRPCAVPQDLANVVTDFEREFSDQGINTLRAAYQR